MYVRLPPGVALAVEKEQANCLALQDSTCKGVWQVVAAKPIGRVTHALTYKP